MKLDLRRLSLAAATAALAFALILPALLSAEDNPDEDEYGGTAGYYGSHLAQLAHLDSTAGADSIQDPEWSPWTYWAMTQPMGTRFLYAAALKVTGLPAPTRIRKAGDMDPRVFLAPEPRRALRVVAALCAAIGLGLIAWRLRVWGVAVAAVFLLLPNVRDDFALAWAEGPLLLGFGLCVASYGSRWFAATLGVAATFKLTALGGWPLLFLPGAAGRGKWALMRAIAIAAGVWAVLTPPSWFAGGPLFLIAMVVDRVAEHGRQNRYMTDMLAGNYLPSRYLWPGELLLLIGLALLARQLIARRSLQPAALTSRFRTAA